MNHIEQEVRAMLRTKVSRAPVREEPPLEVIRHTRVRRARNAFGAAAVAAGVVAGAIFGVQAITGQRTIEPTGPIPWIEREAANPGPDSQPCRSSDVLLQVGASPTRYFHFRPATAAAICTFTFGDGGTTIRFFDSGGRDMNVELGDPITNPIGVGGRVGGHTIPYAWSNYCGPATSSVRVQIAFPGGAGELTSSYATTTPRCVDASKPSTIDLGAIGDVGFTLDPDEDAPDPAYSGLVFSIVAPRTVPIGGTLRYQVIFTNPTGNDIPFDSCPVYRQGLFGVDGVGGFHVLNCDATSGTVPAGGRLVFEMQLAGFDSIGRATLVWGLQTMPHITAPIEVI